MDNKKIAEVEFDIADFKHGKYNVMRLFLEQCKDNAKIILILLNHIQKQGLGAPNLMALFYKE